MSKFSIDQRWFKGYAETKTHRLAVIEGTIPLFDDLREMLNEELQSRRATSEKEDQFENPNWPYAEAYRLGVRKGLALALGLVPSVKD